MGLSLQKFASDLAALKREVKALRTTPQLKHSSVDDGAIAVRVGGQTVAQVGQQYDGTTGAVSLVGPPPPVPSPPTLEVGNGSVRARWDGSWLDGVVAPMDLARVDLHVVEDLETDPLTTPSVGSIVAGGWGDVALPLEPGDYWAYLVAWTTTGKFSVSDPSDPFFVEEITAEAPPPPVPTERLTLALATGSPSVITWNVGGLEPTDSARIYMSRTSPVALTPENLVADGQQRFGGITQHHGEPLLDADPTIPPPVYYVVAVPYNESGDGPVSDELSIAPRRAGAGDLEVESVKAQHLESDLVIATAIWTAFEGARAGMTSEGFFAYDANGETRFAAPNDPEQDFQFRGNAQIQFLTVDDLKLLPASKTTLQSGISAPGTPPSITTDFPTAAVWEEYLGTQRGMAFDGTYLWVAYAFFGVGWLRKLEPTFAADGTINGVIDRGQVELPTPPAPQKFQPDGGVAYANGRLYVLGIHQDLPDNANGWGWRIKIYDIASNTWIVGGAGGAGHWVWSNAWAAGRRPAIVASGSDVGVIGSVSSDARWVTKSFTIQSNGTLSTTFVDRDVTNPSNVQIKVADDMTGAVYTSGDFPDSYGGRWVTTRAADSIVYVWGRDAVRRDSEMWNCAQSAKGGIVYVNGHFYTAALEGNKSTLYLHSNHTWAGDRSSTQKWWAAFSWLDNNVAGGRHESEIGARTAFTMAKRRTPTVSTPPPPNGTGTDKVTGVRIYLKANSASMPAVADMRRPAAEVPDGVRRMTYPKPLDISGGPANSGQYEPFPGATPAAIESQKTDAGGPLAAVRGDGSWRFGPLAGGANGQLVDPRIPLIQQARSINLNRSGAADQSVATGSTVEVAYTNQRYSYGGAFTRIGNNRIRNDSGYSLYVHTRAAVRWQGNATGSRTIAIQRSDDGGATWYDMAVDIQNPGINSNFSQGVSDLAFLPNGSMLRVTATQNSGTTLALWPTPTYTDWGVAALGYA